MKKIQGFFKKYGFYVAVGLICVISIGAALIIPHSNTKQLTDGNQVASLPNDEDSITDEDQMDQTEEESQDVMAVGSPSPTSTTKTNIAATQEEDKQTAEDTTKKDAAVETEDAAAASTTNDPFFGDSDKFAWPVDGEVVVPFTDDSTSSWYSESLNQTMRTFGVCISGESGSDVKAVAKGTVTKIISDSSDYLDAGMPYVGKLMVIDLGNGYTALYGFQGGTVNEELVGQVVNAGDTLGTVGSGKGAFVDAGDNVYLQILHNNEVVNPLNFLADK